jgi:hypothetical protein
MAVTALFPLRWAGRGRIHGTRGRQVFGGWRGRRAQCLIRCMIG